MTGRQMEVKLKPQESDVLTVAPIQKLQGVKDAMGNEALWAPIGLKKMFNGGGALLSHRLCGKEDHPILQASRCSILSCTLPSPPSYLSRSLIPSKPSASFSLLVS
eukprot:266365-Hanusia_phi.AAC.5